MRRFKTDERGGRQTAALVLFLLAGVASCGRPSEPVPVAVTLIEGTAARPAFVRVTGVTREIAQSLSRGRMADAERWQGMVLVSVVGSGNLPMAGTYRVGGDAIEFEPKFGFDAGRAYAVRVNSHALGHQGHEVSTTIVKTAAAPVNLPVRVTGLSPGAAPWPENLLRFYIHFSGPMSRTTALEYVKLLDANGNEIKQAFLPLDVDLWNREHTRFTVFFDPGRVKRGIRPNVEMGRALIAGRKYAIAISAAWPDENGRPLAAPFTQAFTAARAEERAIDPSRWALKVPGAGSRDPLVVAFPWALDHALLQRAIGVSFNGKPLDGAVIVADDDLSWRFTPAAPWQSGAHVLVVLNVLEDPAGNRVGRAFEFEMLKTPQAESPERVTLPFVVK